VSESIVDTASGKVRGRIHDGVHVFRGIPYAASPTGERRFTAPRPPEPWADVRDALHAGPVAPQPPSPLETMFGAGPPRWSEDCLSLNVWTPAPDDARRPVMVWIHGGAFVNGSGATPWYDGTRFATNGDVVVVTINYRLGALGFLHLAPFGGERFADAGNAGILDQIAALRWVHDNIESFGGDPGQVTVFGESAGAMSVGTLLGTPAATGSFQRAIVQSGSATVIADAEEGARIAERVLTKLGLSPARVDDIVDVPTERILEAQTEVYDEESRTQLPFRPVVDGLHLPEPPIAAIARGADPPVPVLVGTTAHEMTLFLAFERSSGARDVGLLTKRARSVFGERADAVARSYLDNRSQASVDDALIAFETDRVFRIPAIRLAEAVVASATPAYMYLFAWETPAFGGVLRSCHALELPFVWDALDQGGVDVFTGTGPERQALARDMHRRWIAFARTGDPGWPAYDTERRSVMVFDGNDDRVVDDPAGDERRLWDGIA
jgi:para-nitrobenzyl esterase